MYFSSLKTQRVSLKYLVHFILDFMEGEQAHEVQRNAVVTSNIISSLNSVFRHKMCEYRY